MRVAPVTNHRRCFNIFLLAIALMVLATGIIGGVYLFKYMIHKVCFLCWIIGFIGITHNMKPGVVVKIFSCSNQLSMKYKCSYIL